MNDTTASVKDESNLYGPLTDHEHAVILGASCEKLRNRIDALTALIAKAQGILAEQLVPDGIGDYEALNRLHAVFDGPEIRALPAERCGGDVTTRICPRCGFATLRPGPKAWECGRILDCGYKEGDQPVAGDAPPRLPEGPDAFSDPIGRAIGAVLLHSGLFDKLTGNEARPILDACARAVRQAVAENQGATDAQR